MSYTTTRLADTLRSRAGHLVASLVVGAAIVAIIVMVCR